MKSVFQFVLFLLVFATHAFSVHADSLKVFTPVLQQPIRFHVRGTGSSPNGSYSVPVEAKKHLRFSISPNSAKGSAYKQLSLTVNLIDYQGKVIGSRNLDTNTLAQDYRLRPLSYTQGTNLGSLSDPTHADFSAEVLAAYNSRKNHPYSDYFRVQIKNVKTDTKCTTHATPAALGCYSEDTPGISSYCNGDWSNLYQWGSWNYDYFSAKPYCCPGANATILEDAQLALCGVSPADGREQWSLDVLAENDDTTPIPFPTPGPGVQGNFYTKSGVTGIGQYTDGSYVSIKAFDGSRQIQADQKLRVSIMPRAAVANVTNGGAQSYQKLSARVSLYQNGQLLGYRDIGTQVDANGFRTGVAVASISSPAVADFSSVIGAHGNGGYEIRVSNIQNDIACNQLWLWEPQFAYNCFTDTSDFAWCQYYRSIGYQVVPSIDYHTGSAVCCQSADFRNAQLAQCGVGYNSLSNTTQWQMDVLVETDSTTNINYTP